MNNRERLAHIEQAARNMEGEASMIVKLAVELRGRVEEQADSPIAPDALSARPGEGLGTEGSNPSPASPASGRESVDPVQHPREGVDPVPSPASGESWMDAHEAEFQHHPPSFVEAADELRAHMGEHRHPENAPWTTAEGVCVLCNLIVKYDIARGTREGSGSAAVPSGECEVSQAGEETP